MHKIAALLLLVFTLRLTATSITINTPEEYAVLDQFFRTTIKEEVFGYVLEGTKPLSALNIYCPDHLMYPNSRFFRWNVLAEEAIEIWNHIVPEQKKIIFKVTKAFNHKYGGFYYELLFINRLKLKEIINDNLDLFRFHLGPTLETSSLVELIADSTQSLDNIIKGNNSLMGILLGYGTHNSLMGGRLEEIQGLHGSLDYPPFIGDNLSQEARENVDWNLQNCFLSCVGSSTCTVDEKLFMKPSLDCSSLKEEANKIRAQKEKVPTTLLKETPSFIFGAYKNAGNQNLFENIANSQKQIQKLLSRSDLLEFILEKISDEKSLIKCSLSPSRKICLPVEGNVEEAVAESLWHMAVQDLDKEILHVFIEAFCRLNSDENKKPECEILPGVLSGLKQAQNNLRIAETQFLTWSRTKAVQMIIPNGLCFECIKLGHGKIFDKATDLLVSYVIEDSLENILAAKHKCWIDPSQTIAGFAHGIKGMREGETRQVYIHPAYGYGALTTLPPCVSLIVKVTLHQIGETPCNDLPSLKPLDLSWVNDPEFFEKIKEYSYQDASYLGNLWGAWLSKSSDINFSKLCNHLKNFSENKEIRSISKNNQRLCNRIFWNLIVNSQSG